MTGGEGGPAVIARALTKCYGGGTVALDRLDLTIEYGEFVGFLGRSGAGKTTFFRLLNGTLRPTAGELTVLGEVIGRLRGAPLRRLRRRVAIVPQAHGLIPPLTAAQNVIAGTLGARGGLAAFRTLAWLTREERAAAWAALERVGIGDKLYARVEHLSGGQQQRVAVARALVQGADLLVADEPVASVDAETASALMDLFRDLGAAGRTVLVSLHQAALAREYCPRIVSLAAGRLEHDDRATPARAGAPIAGNGRARTTARGAEHDGEQDD